MVQTLESSLTHRKRCYVGIRQVKLLEHRAFHNAYNSTTICVTLTSRDRASDTLKHLLTVYHAHDAFQQCSSLLLRKTQITERHLRGVPVRDGPVLGLHLVSWGTSLQPLANGDLERVAQVSEERAQLDCMHAAFSDQSRGVWTTTGRENMSWTTRTLSLDECTRGQRGTGTITLS